MKRLVLLRHAKAVSKEGARDFDRALAPEGREEASGMAGPLAGLDPLPALALVSPSQRTRETWTLASASLAEVPVRFDQAIYEATTSGLLKIVTGIQDDVASCLVVGHNPAFEELANELAVPSGHHEREELAHGMPTGSAAVLDFDVRSWRDVSAGGGQLVTFLVPEGGGGQQEI